eukprot:gene3260-5703_t
MIGKILLTLLTLVTLCITKPIEFKNCGDASVPFKATHIDMLPDIVRPGSTFKIDIKFSNSDVTPITNGIITTRVFKFGIQVQVQRMSICEAIEGGCPIQQGDLRGALKNTIPSLAPGGEYVVKTKTQDRDGRVLSCVDMKFDVIRS